MDPEQARKLLATERARIERALVHLEPQDTGEPRDEVDPGNLASELYQDELDEGLADDLRKELAAIERAEARRHAPLQQRPAGARAEIEGQQARHQCRTPSASASSLPNSLNCVPSGWPKRPRMRPTMRWRVTIGSLPPAPACWN